jgi:PAS domain S-box-containing protein
VAQSLRAAQATVKTREEDLHAATTQAERLAAERTAILGQLMEGVIVTDADGRITFVNAAASRVHGVTHLDVLPHGYTAAYRLLTEDGDPYPPEELPLARAVLRGETVVDARWQIRRPDGTTVLATGSASPLHDAAGRMTGAVLTLRDDTAREQAERLLRKREGELARVQRIGAVGGLEVDLRGGAFRNRRSPEYLRIHGLSEADAFETHENWVARIHPDDRERTVAHFRTTVDGSDRDYEVEYRITRPSDGAERWILAKAEIERDPGGPPRAPRRGPYRHHGAQEGRARPRGAHPRTRKRPLDGAGRRVVHPRSRGARGAAQPLRGRTHARACRRDDAARRPGP